MHASTFSLPRRGAAALALLALLAAGPAVAHKAHTHGRVELDVAVDQQGVSLRMEAPLHDLVGFERAPRTDAERQRVQAVVQRLRAADGVFVPDAQGGCELAEVSLHAPVLGLGAPAGKGEDGHADLELNASFRCARPQALRHLDVQLFELSEGVRTVAAQVAGLQGQGRSLLRPKAARLSLTQPGR